MNSDTLTNRVQVRNATLTDVNAICAIYNQGIRERIATFETTERTPADIQAWFDRPQPLLVAHHQQTPGVILGWIAGSSYSARECYAGIVEFSVYVDAPARGQGVGRSLMSAFITACQAQGYSKILSRIFPENTPSLTLCAQHEFRQVGVYQKHARLDGVWRDVVIVEKLLMDD